MQNWDYYDRDQAIDEAIVLQKAIEDHECDHSDCISKSSLPPLPDGWCGPWEADGEYVIGNNHYRFAVVVGDIDDQHKGAEALAALLNVTHPSPTKEVE